MGDPIQVGVHALCPGNIPSTLTRFDYFRLLKRRKEAAEFIPVIKATKPRDTRTAEERRYEQLEYQEQQQSGVIEEPVEQPADERFEREREDQRRRAARDVF